MGDGEIHVITERERGNERRETEGNERKRGERDGERRKEVEEKGEEKTGSEGTKKGTDDMIEMSAVIGRKADYNWHVPVLMKVVQYMIWHCK